MGDALPTVDLGTGRFATSVVAGADFTCALLDNGQVKCWGANDMGQIGSGGTGNIGDQPGEMGDALAPVELGAGRTARSLSTVGYRHVCALLDDGTLKCWGNNLDGQLGLGDIVNRGDQSGQMGDNLPVAELGTNQTALMVGTGAFQTCALLANGLVKCWGAGGLGLGDITSDKIARGDQPGEMGDALPFVDLGP
jgi:alpha-tubulin suppressor-like RCC1 family protein